MSPNDDANLARSTRRSVDPNAGAPMRLGLGVYRDVTSSVA